MKHLNFLSKSSSQSCGHSSVTLASAVGSPSVHRCGAMLKLLSVLVLILMVGVGQMWGSTSTTTFKDKSSGTWANNKNPLPYQSGGVAWTASAAPYAFESASPSRYIQWAASSVKNNSFTITNTSLANYSIAKVSLVASTNSNANLVNISVSVGSTSFGDANMSKTNNTTYNFPNSGQNAATGNIVITISGENNNNTKSFYLKSITVTYCAVPTSPTNGTITATTADFSWTDAANVGHYDVYCSTSPTAPAINATPTVSGATTKSASVNGLSPNTTYYWWVRAYDNDCKSKWVAGSSFTTESGISCSNSVALSKGTATNGTINTISEEDLATCSETASDRRVTVTITPAECFNAPDALTYTGDGTATMQGPKTDNGNGTFSYVYQFAQNDNGSGTFGVICTAKSAGKTVNFDAGPGVPDDASLTEDCAGAGVTLPGVDVTGVCKGWNTFVGWRATAITDSTTTNAGTILTAGSKYEPTSDGETLYAVYSKVKGGSGTTDITILPSTFSGKGTNSYGSGAERTGSVSDISFGAHYITGNNADNPVNGDTQGKYIQAKATDATIYNKSAFPGYITRVVVNKQDSRDISLYCGTEQLMASNNTSGGQTPSGTKITDVTSATQMTWNVTGSNNYFALKKGSNASYISSIVITYSSATTYYVSDPNCCTNLGTINGSFFWTTTF